ncbi:MAG: choice-of-anchor D domain-containing protein [Ignavibacteria bacterium]|nr:choice-of-anchor D domain-containing protein [Ignavibacteria bacterium]
MHFRYVVAFLFILQTVAWSSTPRSTMRNVPPAFEEQRGQFRYTTGQIADKVDGHIMVGGSAVYIHNGGMHVVQQILHKTDEVHNPEYSYDLYRMDIDLIGSNTNARREWGEQSEGIVRYLTTNFSKDDNVVRRFEKVVYREVYPYIDMRLTANQLGVKIDFIVHPGGNPKQIALNYNGASQLQMQKNGSLLATTELGSIAESAPISWTESAGSRIKDPVSTSYILNGNSVRFEIGEYNKNETLVIDPQRIWATYYGGNADFDSKLAGAVDPNGNIFMGGSTLASDLPAIVGVVQRKFKARLDGFIAKFTDAGKFIWHTYYGTNFADKISDIAADELGNVFACGTTGGVGEHIPQWLDGSDPYAFASEDTLRGNEAFVLKLTGTGLFSDGWYMPGRDDDGATGIYVSGNYLAVTGYSRSPRVGERVGNPFTKNPTNDTKNYDIFIARFTKHPTVPNRWQDDWLTFYGGSGEDGRGYGPRVAMDVQGNVYAVSTHQSTDIPVTDGSTYRGSTDIMTIKLTTPTLHNPVRAWAVQTGSSGTDDAYDIAVDANGVPCTVGSSRGNNFPLVNAIKPALGGQVDGFIQLFNTNTGAVTYSSYYGGDNYDELFTVTFDRSNRIWVGGYTHQSANILITNDAYQKTPYIAPDYGNNDGIFAQLTPNGQTLLYGTYYGAPPQNPLPPPPGMMGPPLPPDTDFGNDEITNIICDGNAYVILVSNATTFRMSTTPGAYQDSSKLKKDTLKTNAFLSFFSNCKDSVIKIVPNGPPVLCATDTRILSAPAGFAKYFWSRGDTTRAITITDSGTYSVVCTTLDGCRYRDSLKVQRFPQPSVYAGRDTSACKNTVVLIGANPIGGTAPFKYKWRRVETGPSNIDNDTLRTPGVNPNTSSRYEVTLTDSAGCTAKDTVWVTIIDPKPVANVTSIVFGNIDPCVASVDAKIKITNNEVFAVTVSDFVADKPNLSLLTPLQPPVTLQPGDTVQITVRITPTSSGTQSGTVTISGSPCNWKIVLPYSVTKSKLVATVIPSSLNYGTTVDCDKVARDTSVLVRNGGTDPMILDPAVVVAPFSLVSPLGQITIPPNDTARIVFRFTPGASGTFSATANMPYTAGSCKDTLRVNLSAAVSAVSIAAAPTTIDYGTLEGCEDSRDSSISISNDGDVPVTITLPVRTDVKFQPAGPITIPANTTIKVTVTILPQTSGAFNQNVDLAVQPCNTTIALTLRAIKNGISVISPSVIDFGEISTCAGGTTATRSFTMSMSGTTSGNIKTVTPGVVVTTSATAGTFLPENSPVTFNMTWTPTADGVLIDSIQFVFDPCGITRTIRVTGTRTSPALTAVNADVGLGVVVGNSSGTVRFTNSGTDTLVVNANALSPDITITAVRPATGSQLLPSQVVEVDYTVACAGRTVISDSLRAFSQTPCPVAATSRFTGTCQQGNSVSTVIVIDKVSGKIGDRIQVPVRLTSSVGLNEKNTRKWTAKIFYNPMVVVGMGTTPDCFVSGQYVPCEIEISGTRTDTVGTLFNLDFTIVLGTSEKTNLSIAEFKWIEDSTALVTTTDGEVTITDICGEGGTRLLNPKASGFSIKVYPQPASTELTVEVLGLGQVAGTYSLYNYVGSLITSGPVTPDASGDALEKIPVNGLGSGTYLLTIDARGNVFRMPVLITK